jgi:DNA-binding response OmpR family regulator
MKTRILVAEDDRSILTGLIDLLEGEGYDVITAADGGQALKMYERDKPHLLLLDVMMPVMSGYDVCRAVRGRDTTTPVLMLTAKGQEVDKVVGLELGADDYIVKPFGVNELLARIRAALRRAGARDTRPDDTPIAFGDVTVDPKTLTGRRGKESFEVTPREVHLLQEFVRHDGEVLDRNALLDRVWGIRYEGTTRTLDQHIAKLRQKIEADPAEPRHIITVHGAGYRFVGKPE